MRIMSAQRTTSLELNRYLAELLARGMRAAKEGRFVAHSEVKKMIQKMGRKK
jgi:predicted transcriptional regulator